MARLLPIQGDTEVPDSGPRVVDLEGDDADAVFSALSSDTARNIYRTLQEDPNTPSEIADSVDTSIQNVRYHLDNLEEAGLVEVVDTWYSSRGNEMSVYAPTSDALVLASGEEQTSRLRTALSRLVSGIVVLALASLAFQRAAKNLVGGKIGLGAGSGAGRPESEGYAADGGDGGGGGGGGGVNVTEHSGNLEVSSQETTTESGGPGIMDADTPTAAKDATQTSTPVETATPADTATPAGTQTQTAAPAGTPTHTQTAGGGGGAGPTGTAPPAGTPTQTATQTPTPAGTPTEPTTTVASDPETTRALTERANETVAFAGEQATTATTAEPTSTTTAADVARTGVESTAAGLPPGLVFFAGGAVVLLGVVAYLYWTGA